MLSRVANNLFWMDRYMERSYGLLNLIITNYNSTLDSGDYSSWNRILKTYMGIGEEMNNHNHKDSISIISFILFNQENPNTIINMIRSQDNHLNTILVVGHNPSIHEVFEVLTGKHLIKYPTGTLTVVCCPPEWENLLDNFCGVSSFLPPKHLHAL